MFLNFFHLVMQQQSLWGNIGIYSDGFRPKPGPRPGARLLEKGPNLSRLGLRHLGKGRKIGDFSTAILSKISRPVIAHGLAFSEGLKPGPGPYF